MLAIVMGLETRRLGGEASLERIFTSGGLTHSLLEILPKNAF